MPSLLNAKITNRTGGNPPASAGALSVWSTSSADNGVLRVGYKHSGAFVTSYESITLAGLTPVPGSVSLDANTPWLAIYGGGTPPQGDIYMSVNGVIIGVIFGTDSGYGNFCASTLYEVALATAQNASISCTNRLSNPASGIGSWSRATWWPGNDSSVAIPGTDLDSGDYIGYVVRLTWPANLPKPPGGQIVCDIDLMGDPDGTADSDIKYYPGADGNPANDTDPVGGAISTGAEINQATANTLIYKITASSTEKTYRGVAYRKNEAV